jgi:hypothetical protein
VIRRLLSRLGREISFLYRRGDIVVADPTPQDGLTRSDCKIIARMFDAMGDAK